MTSFTSLTPERGLIFRVVHRENLAWILDHGLHCQNSSLQAPVFKAIGNPELIERRRDWRVPVPPGGTLGDYVAFYFTPRSPMLLNIKTGYGGIRQFPNQELIICVSSLPRLTESHVPFVYTDRHARLAHAKFQTDLAGLADLPWENWQRSDFRHDPENPDKFERYQAEVLVYQSLPIIALLGFICYSEDVKLGIDAMADERKLEMTASVNPRCYF